MKTAATSRVIAALVVGVLLAALLFVIPAPAGFSPQGWHLLGVLVPIVIIWATEVMPVGVASLLLLTVVCVAGISTPDVAFSGFANHLCWLMLGAFILADAMMASGLSRRMALWLLSKAKSVNSLVGMAFLANLLMAPVPSATARCSILGPLLDAIMESLGRPSRSNLARYLVYAYLMACTGFTGVMILTSGAANGATLAFYEQMTGNTLSFIQWAGLMILPAAFICLCALVIARFFAGKPEPELARKLSDSTRLHDEYAKLGPMTAPEKRVLACVILVLVLWCFGDLVGLKAGFAAILVSALLFLPGMAVVEPRQAMRDVNWSIVLLVGCLVGFGAIVQDTGLADSLASAVFAPIMNPIHQHLGLLGICINVLLVSAIAHFLLPTPNNIVLAAPVLIAWGLSAGLDPAILLGLLVLPVAMHDRIVPLSYQYPPYYVMLGLDLVDTKSFNSLLAKVYPALALCVIPASFICWAMVRLLGIA